MFWFVLAILVVIGGVIGAVAAGGKYNGAAGGATFAGALLLAFLLFVVAGFKSVPTKSIGVPVSFGKVVGAPYGPGLHETWTPWKHLRVLDETIQTTTFEGCQGQFCQKGDLVGVTTPPKGDTGSSTAPCLEVRIGGQQTACLDVTIQWKVEDQAADSLFSDYANQGDLMPVIENAVVVRELRQVANQVLGDYNPIQDVSVSTTVGNSQFTTFQPRVLKAMNADIGSRIQIVSILMPLLRYDRTTQARLNSVQQQYGNTAIAAQEVTTNERLAAAYGKLTKILSANPNVLVAQCLQLTATAEKDGWGGLPPGWNCFGGTSGLAISSRP